MREDILYSRRLPNGPEVRIRRISAPGSTPVTAVLDVERRAGTARANGGTPAPLKQVEGPSEAEVIASLRDAAEDDRVVAGLMFAKGQR
jgi:hypothetical protein